MNATGRQPSPEAIVPVMLNGGRVTASFRAALFAAAAREGVSVNEFVLRSAAEKLRQKGAELAGVFEPGDIGIANPNPAAKV